MLTVKDIIQTFGVSDKTVRRWIYRGDLKVVTFAGRPLKPYRFDETEVLRLFDTQPVRSLKTKSKPKDDAPINKWEDIKWR